MHAVSSLNFIYFKQFKWLIWIGRNEYMNTWRALSLSEMRSGRLRLQFCGPLAVIAFVNGDISFTCTFAILIATLKYGK